MAPMLVRDSSTPESLGEGFEVATLELVGRSCTLEGYKPIKKVPTFNISGDFIAFASPDSTYAVTKQLLDSAKKSILIGIYDFTAGYMKDILLNAMQRGVKVALMLDLDGVKGEAEIFEELAKFGCKCVPAPSCASDNANYFPSSHEKVIVVDDIWVFVQSGNYTNNSIPFNEKDGGDPAHFVKGNRDMGVAIRSKPLAAFFSKVLRSDMQLELDATGGEAVLSEAVKNTPPIELVEAVPELAPVQLFKSQKFSPTKPIQVTPILTPDNYMDVIPGFLESAKKSILIEQQYIKGSHNRIMKLLASIRTAMDNNPDLDVRIILGKIFNKKDVPKERENLKNIQKNFGLKLGSNIRYIDTKRFVHCHNKLIVVDNKAALVSSQNWSETGVGTNREAGVVMQYPEIARYYAKIFESDWSTAIQTLPKVSPEAVTAAELASGKFVEVAAADYQEV